MKAELHMHLSTQTGSLERVLRTVRHRGFHITALQVTQSTPAAPFEVALSVESERPVTLLTKQLRKLFDVAQLEVAKEVNYARSA